MTDRTPHPTERHVPKHEARHDEAGHPVADDLRPVDHRPVDHGGETTAHPRGGRVHIPRSRGALSGLLLVVAGAWGALAPFVGPLFDFGFTPREAWTWTTGRGWLEVLPGVVCVLGGLFLLFSRNRVTAMFGGWLAVAAGVWFVIGRQLAQPWGLGDPGEPGGSSPWLRALEDIALFSGLGALIVFLAAGALGRLSVRSVRDIRAAEVRHRTDIE